MKNNLTISKHNPNRQKQVIILMILNGEELHYVTVKNYLAILRGIA